MRTILIAALAVTLAGPALAQNAVTDKINEQPDITTSTNPANTAPPYAGSEAGRDLDNLIGRTVTSPQGEELGDVENVLIRPDGQVAGLVVEWGGLATIGANQVAVPWDDVRVDGDKVTVNASKAELEKAPKYDPDVPAAAGVDPDVKPLRR
ncbi:PRC-barrel domain-containing protein [Azospirillum sp. SYSU D00513]|uniref:PRC-barrel domain-containing protein n=1 Tax=Azospirillum sp. SYSU D00513 TaxID=2812561 RepID=UPI001A957123|nr:PRC-barrel domain-containing protein [Azospirillum sp. SYSU D00513]